MNGCSLDDAFPMDDGVPSPGCQQPYSSKEARKEERRKAKKCRGPPMAFLDVKDPDRQHVNKTPAVPAMNTATGLREHVPVDSPVGYEPYSNYTGPETQSKKAQGFQGGPNASPYQGCDYNNDLMCQRLRETLPRSDDDPVGDKVRSVIPISAASAKPQTQKKNYFGADPEDGFADYQPEAANFLMEPTIENGFGIGSGPSAALPVPSVSDYWKPLTGAGVETSFFNTLPAPGGRYVRQDKVREKVPQWEEPSINRKIDQIMARLDDIQRRSSGSPEQAQTEIMMFVSSGIFVLFLMDLLVKKGGKLF